MMPATTPDETTLLLLHAYLDGELDPANALEIERRIANDPALAAEYKRIEPLRQLMRERLPSEELPPGLQARITAAVGVKQSRDPPSWRQLAASIAITAVLASGATWIARGPGSQDGVRDAIVDAHIRSLMAPKPADGASSDQPTVNPWVNGRIPEAPKVVDLATQDFPLVGGRIDVIAGKPAPTLVYSHRKHLISLTALPEADAKASPATFSTTDGYNIFHWSENGVVYWAISDL